MPVCQFFLRGTCSNDNCPYSHVNVSKKAEVCEDFLKGFCSRGQQVTLESCCVFATSRFGILCMILFCVLGATVEYRASFTAVYLQWLGGSPDAV